MLTKIRVRCRIQTNVTSTPRHPRPLFSSILYPKTQGRVSPVCGVHDERQRRRRRNPQISYACSTIARHCCQNGNLCVTHNVRIPRMQKTSCVVGWQRQQRRKRLDDTENVEVVGGSHKVKTLMRPRRCCRSYIFDNHDNSENLGGRGRVSSPMPMRNA